MILPRQLLFEDHPLEWFKVNSKDSIFSVFFNVMKQFDGMRPIDANSLERIIRVWNEACYICTDVSFQLIPQMAFGEYIKYCNYSASSYNIKTFSAESQVYTYSILLCTAYLLAFRKEHPLHYIGLCDEISSWTKQNPMNLQIKFRDVLVEEMFELESDLFVPRHIDKELLEKVEWEDMTSQYDLDVIRRIVRSVGQNNDERRLVIDSIRQYVKYQEDNELPF